MKLNLKSDWSDLTIKDYVSIQGMTPEDNPLDILAILTDKPREELEALPLKAIQQLIIETDFIFNDEPNTASAADALNDWTYTDSARWKPEMDISNLTAGQLIDIMELGKDKDTITENLHVILSILLNKQERKWLKWRDVVNREIMKDAEHLFNTFPADRALSIVGFFLPILESLSSNTLASLRKKHKKQMKKELNKAIPSNNNSVGS